MLLEDPEALGQFWNGRVYALQQDGAPVGVSWKQNLVMADFRSYVDAWEKLTGSYGDQETWNRKALLNTASSGWFSSDRTIREYRDEIWHA